MLKLTKIRKTDDFISANYIPEGSLEMGFLKVQISTKQIVEKKETRAYGLQIAKNELLRVAKLSPVPEEKVYLWF